MYWSNFFLIQILLRATYHTIYVYIQMNILNYIPTHIICIKYVYYKNKIENQQFIKNLNFPSIGRMCSHWSILKNWMKNQQIINNHPIVLTAHFKNKSQYIQPIFYRFCDLIEHLITRLYRHQMKYDECKSKAVVRFERRQEQGASTHIVRGGKMRGGFSNPPLLLPILLPPPFRYNGPIRLWTIWNWSEAPALCTPPPDISFRSFRSLKCGFLDHRRTLEYQIRHIIRYIDSTLVWKLLANNQANGLLRFNFFYTHHVSLKQWRTTYTCTYVYKKKSATIYFKTIFCDIDNDN